MSDPDSTTISVECFGDFQLSCNGRTVERWKGGKAKNLLQYLLLRRGRIVGRDNLYEALWPEAPWSSNSSSLKVAVHMLRRILDHVNNGRVETAPGSTLLLLTRESGYMLEADNVWVDFEAFDRLIDAGHAAQLQGRDASEMYRQAAQLYRGDFLPDVDSDWAAVNREWLRSRVLCALSYLIEQAVVNDDQLGVLRWCQRMLDIEPFHEKTYRVLILVHGQQGQLAQVRRWHRLCVTRLHEGLQVGPQQATQRLYAQAMRGEFVGRPLGARAWRRTMPQFAIAK